MSVSDPYKFTIEDVRDYLKTIFDLQSKVVSQDSQIALLQYELDLEKTASGSVIENLLQQINKEHLS